MMLPCFVVSIELTGSVIDRSGARPDTCFEEHLIRQSGLSDRPVTYEEVARAERKTPGERRYDYRLRLDARRGKAQTEE